MDYLRLSFSCLEGKKQRRLFTTEKPTVKSKKVEREKNKNNRDGFGFLRESGSDEEINPQKEKMNEKDIKFPTEKTVRLQGNKNIQSYNTKSEQS